MASGTQISVNTIDWEAIKYTDSHGNMSRKNKTTVVVAVKYNVKYLFLETEIVIIAKCKQNRKLFCKTDRMSQ